MPTSPQHPATKVAGRSLNHRAPAPKTTPEHSLLLCTLPNLTFCSAFRLAHHILTSHHQVTPSVHPSTFWASVSYICRLFPHPTPTACTSHCFDVYLEDRVFPLRISRRAPAAQSCLRSRFSRFRPKPILRICGGRVSSKAPLHLSPSQATSNTRPSSTSFDLRLYPHHRKMKLSFDL